MEWAEDAIAFFLPRMKNDQTGKRGKDPKHVYANPFQPEICPFISLGVYLLCHAEMNAPQLFPGTHARARRTTNVVNSSARLCLLFVAGGNQPDRVSSALKRVIDATSKTLEFFGLKSAWYGLHSYRKGPITYATSGTTDGPNMAAVYTRGGWTLPGVLDRYMKYAKAGDQFVGRIIAGLTPNTVEFATLPPHFTRIDSASVDKINAAVDLCFPLLACGHANLRTVVTHLLASVVYHRKWLRDTLPPNHALFNSAAFSSGVVDDLAPLVGLESDLMRPTGIPGTVRLAQSVAAVQEGVDSINEKLGDQLMSRIEGVLEKRDVACGSITMHAVNEAVTGIVDSAVASLTASLQGTTHIAAPPASNVAPPLPLADFRTDFALPTKVDAITAFRLWFRGNATLNYPPIRHLATRRLNRRVQQSYSEWKCLMKWMEEAVVATDASAWKDEPSDDEMTAMFELGKTALLREPTVGQKRKRRVEQLTVSTLVRLMRKKRRVEV